VQAAFEQEVAPASDKAKAFDATTAAASRPAVPRRLHAENAEDANPVRPAYDQPAATPATATAQPLPAAAQPAPTASLSLGSHSDKNLSSKTSPLSAAITVGGSLALVLGLFLLVAWVMRKTAPRGSILLPREVFEILGRAPLGARQQVQLLRCGNKLLLVSIMPGGAETLTEVTDPLEVDRLAGICQQANPKSSTMAFRQVFQQLAPKSGEPSALEVESPGSRKRRYRWEEKHA
jgi:flagellar biogenesis protein FliO